MTSVEAILSRLEIFGIRLGLDQSRRLLAALGSPQEGLPVVLVAGSNGKGSTAALLASIVGAAGYRVGLYTSPHLEDVEERLRINGRSIDPGALATLLQKAVEVGVEKVGAAPTYFEALTVAAYVHFREQAVDLAVMEVGLGGRLDATNVADPVLSVISSIALDHQNVLGESLAEIAREKAGILRPGTGAVSWVDATEAREALFERAEEIGAPLVDVRGECRWEDEVTLETEVQRYELEMSLAGACQRRNAALAVRAAEHLGAQGWSAIDCTAVEAGVALCRWPGRLERIEIDGGPTVILDGAHNREAMVLLSSHLADLADFCSGDGEDEESYWLIFGALRDKAADAMLETISRGADHTILAAPRSPRAIASDELAAAHPGQGFSVASTSEEALDNALESGVRRIVVCGSTYLVGEIRVDLRRRFGVPQAATAVRTGP